MKTKNSKILNSSKLVSARLFVKGFLELLQVSPDGIVH